MIEGCTTVIISDESTIEIVEELKKCRILMIELKKEEEKLRQKLYNYMGEHDILINPTTGEEAVKWSYSDGYEKFDSKKFMLDNPEIYGAYTYRTDPVRTLRIGK